MINSNDNKLPTQYYYEIVVKVVIDIYAKFEFYFKYIYIYIYHLIKIIKVSAQHFFFFWVTWIEDFPLYK